MNKLLKQELLKKKALLSALALSSSIMVSGCGETTNDIDKLKWEQSYIRYSDGVLLDAYVKYADLDYLKILDYNKGNNHFTRLVVAYSTPGLNDYFVTDVETNTEIINSYYTRYGKLVYKVGEDLVIDSEENLSDYLLKDENIKPVYSLEEILQTYHTVEEEKESKRR